MNELDKEIRKTQEEVSNLQKTVLEKEAYLAGLLKASKLQEKAAAKKDHSTLRPGTMMYNTMEVLKKGRRPMHISDILKALGKEITKKNRVSLAGSLNAYAKKEQIFTKPQPNTFGLIDFEASDDSDDYDLEGLFSDSGESEESDNDEIDL